MRASEEVTVVIAANVSTVGVSECIDSITVVSAYPVLHNKETTYKLV